MKKTKVEPVDGVVCAVTHGDLPVVDRLTGMLVTGGAGFRGGGRVDHVEVIGNVEHVREAQLGRISRRDEVTKMYCADYVIIVRTLASQRQIKTAVTCQISTMLSFSSF